MYRNNRILAIVPARGGSKGIPLKNIQPVLDIPLVAKVGQVVQELPCIDRAIVSTDHPQIAQIAQSAGLDVPFIRPAELSGDQVADWDVLNHALRAVEEADNQHYDIVVMLQPTSPLRTAYQVQQTIEKLVNEKLDAVWTVSPTDSKSHPLKQLKIIDGQLTYYDPRGKEIIARQQLETVYHRNGVAYAITRECLINQKAIKGNRTGALIIDEIMISIDTPWDLELTEFILKNR
jgi:CMP-N,N'-diacetyllegionaminic acid synthase